MRVLFAPRNTSGQARAMASAIERFGHEGAVWSFGPPALGFEADRVFDRDRLLTHPDYRWEMFSQAVSSFDVFHFMYGRSLIDPVDPTLPPLWDIPLLKALGKRVVMHYRGSDIRLPSVHKAREPDSYFNHVEMSVDEDRIRNRVSIARRHCDALLVSTPGLIDYVPDALLVPHVVDPKEWTSDGTASGTPEVVHIPTNAAVKGSDDVDAALRPLVDEGTIHYRRLEGLDRGDLRSALAQADIVVDSLRIGDHGLISVEAMASGCVAIAHIHESNRRRTPGVPVVEASRETLRDTVLDLAVDPDRRAELASAGRDWVANHNSPDVVGGLLDSLYRRQPAEPSLHRPDWPIEAGSQRIERLEADVERLTTQGHELFAGWVPPAARVPSRLIERLADRIRQLEKQVEGLGGTVEDPIGEAPVGRPRSPGGIRDRLRRYPQAHLWVRRARRWRDGS